jgi:hypothetical protein
LPDWLHEEKAADRGVLTMMDSLPRTRLVVDPAAGGDLVFQ